jgi:hypothetical protein
LKGNGKSLGVTRATVCVVPLFPDPDEQAEWLDPAVLELADLRAYLDCKRHPAKGTARMALKLAIQLVQAVGRCRDDGWFRSEVAEGLRRAADAFEGPKSA